jgi:hypothetical protein
MVVYLDAHMSLLLSSSILFGFTPQALGHAFVPGLHGIVRAVREAFLGEQLRKELAGLWILDVELLDCLLQKRNVLLGSQQQLYRLPRDESPPLQRRDRWRTVAIIVGRGLQAMECAQRPVYEGDGRRRRLDEQHVVVAAHGPVEGGELRRREVRGVVRFELGALRMTRLAVCRTSGAQRGPLTMVSAMPLSRRSNLSVPHLSSLIRYPQCSTASRTAGSAVSAVGGAVCSAVMVRRYKPRECARRETHVKVRSPGLVNQGCGELVSQRIPAFGSCGARTRKRNPDFTDL